MIVDIPSSLKNTLATSSAKKRRAQLRNISLIFGGDGESIDLEIFDRDDFMDTLLSAFDSKEYSENTRLNYCGALLSFCESHKCDINVFNQISQYQSSLGRPKSKVTSDRNYLDKLEILANDNDIRMRTLYCVFKFVGAIRLFELIRTSIVDKRELGYNFLDLENKIWYIVKEGAKTRQPRQFPVSDEFVKTYNATAYWKGTEFLLYDKSIRPYTQTSSLSMKLKKLTGINFQTVRRSDVLLSHDDSNTQDMVEKANVLGHKPSTQVLDYANPKEGEQKPKPKLKIRIKPKITKKPNPWW